MIDLFARQFWFAVRGEQAIGFLSGIGKLRVAETREYRAVENGFDQFFIFGEKCIRVRDGSVAEPFGLCIGSRTDATEFGEHEWLARVLIPW